MGFELKTEKLTKFATLLDSIYQNTKNEGPLRGSFDKILVARLIRVIFDKTVFDISKAVCDVH